MNRVHLIYRNEQITKNREPWDGTWDVAIQSKQWHAIIFFSTMLKINLTETEWKLKLITNGKTTG